MTRWIDQQSHEYFEEHAVQTARVLYATSYFDDTLSDFLAEYLELNELQDNALLRPMSTRSKIDLLGRLAKTFLEPKAEKTFRPFLNEAKSALDERNSMVHGVPATDEGKFCLVSWTGKDRLNPQPRPWPVEKVCQLAFRFVELEASLKTLLDGFRERKAGEGSDDSDDISEK